MKKKREISFPCGDEVRLQFRKMKLTAILLFIVCVSFGNSFSQVRLSVSFNKTDIRDALQSMEEKTNYVFLYKDEIFDNSQKISANFTDAKFEDVLKNFCEQTHISYEIRDRQIILKEMTTESSGTQSQQKPVSGKVTDNSGTGLPGVSVVVKGTTNGVTTDINGKYTLSRVPENAILQFSFVGMKPQEIKIGTQATINVVLADEAIGIEEVVAVGYGTVKKSDLTGSVTSVSAEELSEKRITSLDQGLQGMAAGVFVSKNSGAPGGGMSVQIRGVSSINSSNEPLYVVDGFPMDKGNGGIGGTSANSPNSPNILSTLNPNDIESIEILKDASAQAIYGARAANGVVLITTKRGKSGKSNVTFDMYTGVHALGKKLNVLNAADYASFSKESYENDGAAANPLWANPSQLKNIDWQDAIYRKGEIKNYNLTVSGGNETTRGVVSAGYLKDEGLVITNQFERYSVRANIDHTINKWITSGISVNFSTTNNNQIPSESTNSQSLGAAPLLIPILDGGSKEVKDAQGNYGYFLNNPYTPNDADNLVAVFETNERKLRTNRIISTGFLEVEPIKGLKIKSLAGADVVTSGSSQFSPAFSRGRVWSVQDINRQSKTESMTWLVENTISYAKTMDQHTFNVVIGQTAQKNNFSYVAAQGAGYVSPAIHSIGQAQLRDASGSSSSWSLNSYLSRLNYTYMNKYLFTATYRVDGSSRFGQNNKFAGFPSASIGWKISEEGFMKSISSINSMKLRVGWGQTGNQEIPLFAYLPQMSSNPGYSYIFYGSDGGVRIPGTTYAGIANPDLKWETSEQTNIGLDGAFFDSRLTLSLDYYIKNTKDLLLNLPLPRTQGFGSILKNAGQIRNSGLEISLGYKNSVGDFNYSLGANMTTIKNEVISLGGGEPIMNTSAGSVAAINTSWPSFTRTEEGQPIGYFYGWVTDGIYQNQAQIDADNAKAPKGLFYQSQNTKPGDRRFKDLNGDHVIDLKDRTKIGNPFPKVMAGLNGSANYKGFDFSFYINGIFGNDILSYQKRMLTTSAHDNSPGGTNVSYDYYNNRWHGEGTSNVNPRGTMTDLNQNHRVSDAYIEDGTYVRLQNIQFGYNIPKNLAGKIGMSSARVYISGQNLVTLTKYSGWDPEIGTLNGNATVSGVDFGTYPSAKTYMMGLTLSF